MTKEFRELREEARVAGDWHMADICTQAIDGSAAAIRECDRVLEDAKAQLDQEEATADPD